MKLSFSFIQFKHFLVFRKGTDASPKMLSQLARVSSRTVSAGSCLLGRSSSVGISSRSIVSATEGTVLYEERDDGVGVITLNVPDKLNALSADMGDEFLEVVEHLRTETSNVNAVVLTGAGKAFSAGGDLKFLMQRHQDTPSRNTYVQCRDAEWERGNSPFWLNCKMLRESV